MSSDEEGSNFTGAVGSYKRRRACDICRRKKIRCNGLEFPGVPCSNCEIGHLKCTYVEESKRRAPSKKYIASLEDKIIGLDQIIRQLCPDDKTPEAWIAPLSEGSLPKKPLSFSSSHLTDALPPPSSPTPSVLGPNPTENFLKVIRAAHTALSTPYHKDTPYHEDEEPHIAPYPSSLDTNRFFGNSSGEMLIHTALSMKQELVGAEKMLEWPILCKRREEFWTIRPWEQGSQVISPPHYNFPAPDLAKDLVELYFKQVNLYLPLLHRPSFERSLRDGLHYANDSFSAVYLLVCAVGSRFSTDPRVLLDGIDSFHSAGWRWFQQVETAKTPFLSLPCLYDLQLYCLSVIFLMSASAPHSAWVMVGIAIRLAQDVGVHRRRGPEPTKEDELWKQAFWILISVDRVVSTALGRPLSVQDEDLDLDLPVDCDDEYWEHPDPAKRFKQPPNKPSLMSAFILQLTLSRIGSCCTRGLYSLNKMQVQLGLVGEQWKAHVVTELDSSLNKWLQSVPEHLRWDPDMSNPDFFNQSTVLYAMWHHTQILVHRPFIPSPSKPSSLSFPSLAICTNAARSCIRLAYTQLLRNTIAPPPVQTAAFASAVVLLFGIWDAHASALPPEQHTDTVNVSKVLQILKAAEERWHQAGRLWDALTEVASVDHLQRSGTSTVPPAAFQECQGQEAPSLPHSPTRFRSRVAFENDDSIQISRFEQPTYSTSGDNSMDGHASDQPASLDVNGAYDVLDSHFDDQSVRLQHPVGLPDQCSMTLMTQSTWIGSSDDLGSPQDQVGQVSTAIYNPSSYQAQPQDQLTAENGPSQESGNEYLTGGLMSMWSSAPPGFGLDDWDSYFTNTN